ncbi:MAG: hypothetical protein OEW15_03220 [Nitrospirota bacterium]|nr:hypothetical protein [Nitrospirota bacterium]
MIHRLKTAVLLGVAVFTVFVGAAYADEYHYINQIVGDRAVGMGGAYTAVSDDVAGLFYNPAGIAYSTGANLSGSVNAYSSTTKKYDNVLAGKGWERTSTALLPNFFGIVQPLGNIKFGFSYAVPDSARENQDQTFANVPSQTPGVVVNKYVINFNNEDNTYNFGPTVAMDLNNASSIGLTLYFHQRFNQLTLNQYLEKNTAPATYEWDNVYSELSEWGFKPVLGYMWTPLEKLSLGLSLSKVMVQRSLVRQQTTMWDSGTGIVTNTTIDSHEKRKYPVQARLGAAYFLSNALLISGDVIYDAKVTDAIFGDKVKTMNVALGTEYYYDKNWALRGGFYTDMANSAEVELGRQNQDEHLNLYGLTASVTNFSRNTSVTLGGGYSFGRGKAQVIANSDDIQTVRAQGFTVYISSAYMY